MAVLTLIAVAVAPWAAYNRETGARSAVLLLPERHFDFTGRTPPVDVPGSGVVLLLTLLGAAGIGAAAAAPERTRRVVWLGFGALLVGVTAWGYSSFNAAVGDARIGAFENEVTAAIAAARPNIDVERLQEALAGARESTLDENIAAARTAGLVIRRLPYTNSGFGPTAFFAVVTGLLALLFGAKVWPRAARAIDGTVKAAAVPAISIVLALLAAAVVILALQPTPLGSNIDMSSFFTRLVGRIDTLWHAYYTMFHDSLGTVNGFAESLKIATPLIFTGLAVGFSFQAGLFNIGAPGQMVIGSIFAMLAALYIPGPKAVVLPLAILSAALGGALWGGLAGWLKARFGANEVINTILLNFVAASVLLFILSAGNVFAAAAVRIIVVLVAGAVAALVLMLIPAVRRAVGRAPRAVFAGFAVLLLSGCVVAGLPRAGDAPVTLRMPFKVPGNEPKSRELNVQARLPQLPAIVGIDLRANPGVNVVRIDYAKILAPLAALAALALLGRWRAFRAWPMRLVGAVGVGVVVYLLGMLFQLTAVPTAIPPTKLNLSFLLALAAAVLVYVLLFRTRWGYELRAVGLAPRAAEYGGANIARNTLMAMAISGGLAGLTATHYVLGGALEDYALRQSIPTSDGFDGIAVTLLAANNPFGTVLAAFLFGVLKYGGSVLNITFPDLTRDVVSMILALVVLFIAARGFMRFRAATAPAKPAADDAKEAAKPATGEI